MESAAVDGGDLLTMNLNMAFARNWSLPPAIQRLSGRERLLIGSLGMIALILLPLKAYDWQQTAAADVAGAQVDLAGAQQAARGGQGLQVVNQLSKQNRDIRAWSWIAPSRPVARVMLENSLATLGLKVGMPSIEVKSSDLIETVGGVDFVRLDVTAPFDWATTTKFLAELSKTNKGFILDSIAVPEETPPKAQMVLRLPIAAPKPAPPKVTLKARPH